MHYGRQVHDIVLCVRYVLSCIERSFRTNFRKGGREGILYARWAFHLLHVQYRMCSTVCVRLFDHEFEFPAKSQHFNLKWFILQIGKTNI